jgi:uncharacterized repeat protein (TIGR04076 family)
VPKAKITVVKRLNMKDLYGESLPAACDEGKITPECQRFRVGQEFIVESHNCPPDFCNWAFADIQRDLVHILYGGYYPWMKEKGVALTCCTDGFRPVVFRIERIED